MAARRTLWVTIKKPHPVRADQIAGEAENLIRRRLVEISGGLVGEQEKRLYRQCAADGDALLLTAGQLLGIAF